MKRWIKAISALLACLFLTIGGILAFGLVTGVDREIAFDDSSLPDDLDGWLVQRELQFSDIRAGDAKRIVWAGDAGARTPLAVIYIHGFSAGPEEIRPVPDRVAQALGANLYFTRLTGHGRSGDAMAEATADDWIEDMAEAMAIGRRLGERVLVISTSTGATLAAVAATDPALSRDMAGLVMVSPNFRLRSAAGMILDQPFAPIWGPWLAGDRRSFAPKNPAHAAHWTTDYPTAALFPMAALMREARAQDYSAAQMPVLFLYSPDDRVIDPAAILPVRDGWGGPVTEHLMTMGPGDDPQSHLIAGDVMSPGQTQGAVDHIVTWARGL
ncbi:MAG: lysophospholipase [Cypionkella sp.]|jgi:alpha-beta hydrolase superfamily lysophospholipase|nr:lysophospholipase [Cypionkella sp.]